MFELHQKLVRWSLTRGFRTPISPRIALAILAAALHVSPLQQAAAQTFGPSTAVNNNANADTGDDHSAKLATNGAGNWVVVWHSEDDLGSSIGTDGDILVARNSGTGWSSPAALNTNAATDSGNDRSPQVATDGAGNWVTIWDSTDTLGNTIGADFDILVSRSLDNGATWSSVVALASNAGSDSGNDTFPNLVTDGAGTWLATWTSLDTLGGTIGTDRDILISRSADAGMNWSPPVALNVNASSDSGIDAGPHVTTDAAGNWVAVWYSSESLSGTIGTDHDILVARSVNNGVSWTAPTALNTNAASDSGIDADPKLSVDAAGNWIAVWHSLDDLGGTIGTDFDILVSRSSDDGVTWTPPAALNTNAASDGATDRSPQLTNDNAGNWTAVWQSDDSLAGTIGIDTDILVSRSSDAGSNWSAQEALTAEAATDSGNDSIPQLATDGEGFWLAVWYSDDAYGALNLGADLDVVQAIGSGPDTDGDGLSDGSEVNTYGTDPLLFDTDGDGLGDGFEVTYGFNPLVGGEQNLDPDLDGLQNLGEQAAGTDPGDADSDDDGLSDSVEVFPVRTLGFGSERLVASPALQARTVNVADFDSDGDVDVLAPGIFNQRIAWSENLGNGESFDTHQIVSAQTPESLFPADLDGDGDPDILSGSSIDDAISWFENRLNEASADFADQVVISNSADRPESVFAADLDGDGDMDFVVASSDDDKVAWYENTDGAASFGSEQIIDGVVDGAIAVFVADLDGDGDPDIVTAANLDDEIAWYENRLDELSTDFGPKQVITGLADGAQAVFVADLDGDGDPDVLSASAVDTKIAWYENTDGGGTFGPQQVIFTSAHSKYSVFAADFDNDGDMDVLSGATNVVGWYENTDGAGSFGSQNVITSTAGNVRAIFAADLNGDRNLDVITTSRSEDNVTWFTNQGTNPLDPDTDDDGVCDGTISVGVECVDGEITQGTDPHLSDTDGDGLDDGEELTLGTNPLDADTDTDGLCDGSGTGGGACVAGPDLCPYLATGTEADSGGINTVTPDGIGDGCQCGDVTNNGIVNTADLQTLREFIVGATLSDTFVGARCNVLGTRANDGSGSDCDVADAMALERILVGEPVDRYDNGCDAYYLP